jgi:uroporphyrin-III C-methyltransferase/precorrin-2 dehydrogenase/sirohydrochlorin ferrochelatase
VTLYPVFLDLRDARVVIVGGGTVAAAKLDGLLAAGARVTVVAPTICDAIRVRDVRLVERAFVATDLDACAEVGGHPTAATTDVASRGGNRASSPRWIVAAATPEVNRQVAIAAAARGLFVNAVDDKASATAYLGGVIRRGEVTVAISTGGIAPALAGLLREALDAVLPEDLERWIEVARDARASWKRNVVPMPERRPLLLRALDRIYGGAS